MDALKVPVQVEQDTGDRQQEVSPNPPDFRRFRRTGEFRRCGCYKSNQEGSEREVEDHDVSSPISIFKFNSAAFELDISGSEQVSLTRSMDSDVKAQNTPVVGPCWDDLSNK